MDGNKQQDQRHRQENASEAISICRREILSLIEAVYGNTPRWRWVRTQLLGALGEQGLEGRIAGILMEGIENGNSTEHGGDKPPYRR